MIFTTFKMILFIDTKKLHESDLNSVLPYPTPVFICLSLRR